MDEGFGTEVSASGLYARSSQGTEELDAWEAGSSSSQFRPIGGVGLEDQQNQPTTSLLTADLPSSPALRSTANLPQFNQTPAKEIVSKTAREQWQKEIKTSVQDDIK